MEHQVEAEGRLLAGFPAVVTDFQKKRHPPPRSAALLRKGESQPPPGRACGRTFRLVARLGRRASRGS